MSYEILQANNGFILRPRSDYDRGVSIERDVFVFNTAKDLGQHITENFKTLQEEKERQE
jgi:hypothetical protein